MKKILYITSKPIYPTVDGGCIAMENFLKCLSYKDIQVKHLLIETVKHPYRKENYPTEIIAATQPESVFIDTEVKAGGAFVHLFKKGSYNIDRFYSDEMKSLIERVLEDDSFDCVILESLYLTPYTLTIRNNFSGKIFVRAHNVESEIWKSLSHVSSGGLKKKYLARLAKDLRSYEIDALNQVDGILGISTDDLVRFKEMGVKSSSVLIPVAIELAQKQEPIGKNLFHLGAMNWQPNVDAVNRLISLFPTLRSKHNSIELHIGGSHSAEMIKEDQVNGIFVDGYIDDLSKFAAANGILVSPIVSGSGIRIKILEMMAMGIPVVTTKLGALGIDYKQNNCLITAETDDDLIEACNSLIENETMRMEIGNKAIEYIRKNHNIELISTQILEFIERT
ncbi:MAG: glycosyltransferase family 4 protein [Crocinitomicaceae bacterium]|nr:glycosyltransferase family 4 protein [Crocinitomicaceae bacterium]